MGKRTAAPTRKRVGSKSVCVLRTRGNVASQLFLWKGELQGDVFRVHPNRPDLQEQHRHGRLTASASAFRIGFGRQKPAIEPVKNPPAIAFLFICVIFSEPYFVRFAEADQVPCRNLPNRLFSNIPLPCCNVPRPLLPFPEAML